MTGPRFAAETAALRAQASSLAELSARLNTIMSTLHSNLAGEGAAWGGDEPGQRFSSSYLPQKDGVDRATEAQVQFLSGNAEALNTTANTAEHL